MNTYKKTPVSAFRMNTCGAKDLKSLCFQHLQKIGGGGYPKHLLSPILERPYFFASTGFPLPSFTVRIPSTANPSNRSVSPFGQRTSTQSTFAAPPKPPDPKPKCTRISLFESRLDPLRTSSTRSRPPACTRIFAPIPSRLDFVPTVLIPIQ